MADIEDRVTVTFVNGEVSEVTSSDPSRIYALDNKDLEHIERSGAQTLRSVRCEKNPDGFCYYYIGGRKVRCTCPPS